MQKQRNRKSQRAKITSSIYLQYVLHWIYFIFFFFRNRLRRWLYFRTSTFTWEVTGRNFVFLSWYLHFAAKDSKDINLYRFHMLISSHSSQHLTFLLSPLSDSRKFGKAITHLLAHSWCTFDARFLFFTFY